MTICKECEYMRPRVVAKQVIEIVHECRAAGLRQCIAVNTGRCPDFWPRHWATALVDGIRCAVHRGNFLLLLDCGLAIWLLIVLGHFMLRWTPK